MTDPPISSVHARSVTIPTDQPEADGTLAWDSTTMVTVEVHAGGEVGTGWTWAPAAAVRVVDDLLAPVVCGRSPLAPRWAMMSWACAGTASASAARAIRILMDRVIARLA